MEDSKPAMSQSPVNVEVLLSTDSTQNDFDAEITKLATMHYDRYVSNSLSKTRFFDLRFSKLSLSLSLSLSVCL